MGRALSSHATAGRRAIAHELPRHNGKHIWYQGHPSFTNIAQGETQGETCSGENGKLLGGGWGEWRGMPLLCMYPC